MYGYDSDDEGPTEELDEDGFTTQENGIFKKVTGKGRGAPLLCDLTLAGKALVDGGMRLGLLEPTRCPKVGDSKPKDEDENAHLKKGIKFGCLQEFKIWLSAYAIRNHRPFVIDHSDQNLRYIIKCGKEGMASSGSIPRPPCDDVEDMPTKWKEATLDKTKDKVTPSSLQVFHMDRPRDARSCSKGPI
ncbi:hypothetical protein D1007_07494 [Hordeum vulgare]|nr:hypothetical protein D1007_07494 [Hordeum vulgare]